MDEQGGNRPVLIIQNNIGNKHSPTVIVAAITGKANQKAKLPTHCYLEAENGLEMQSIVLLTKSILSTSDRVKWGQKRRMEQGVVFGRDMLGYDVKNGEMFINEEGASIVRLVFHKFVEEGKGTHVIARELREAGIKPMRVKEWQNTVILRIIRNEKYCGDLVQKKTFTPDYLSHDKKYNRGQEEFIIINDHHEPIISREMFDAANKILDERALSQEGKAKHSNRYAFSGKIKCGACGGSYVARYKKRKDGSQYKASRCMEGARYGSPHIDKAGNQVGCTSESIRNEDALYIMYLVSRSLEMKKNKIIKNMVEVINSVVSYDVSGTDTDKLRDKIKVIEEKKSSLIELYMSKDINRDEFSAARIKCDDEITQLNELIQGIEKKDTIMKQQNDLLKDISVAINEIVDDLTYEDEFYKKENEWSMHILHSAPFRGYGL